MEIIRLRTIPSFFFSAREVAQALGIGYPSARVACFRYVKGGFLIRVKKDIYTLPERWEAAGAAQFYSLANRLQVPSYVSFLTALSFYEITTQIQQNFFESAAVIKTKDIEVQNTHFRYFKLKKELYFGFVKTKGFFMAVPEKAFLDALYLMSMGRYGLDFSSLDLSKLDQNKLKRLAGKFPLATQKLLETHANFKTT